MNDTRTIHRSPQAGNGGDRALAVQALERYIGERKAAAHAVVEKVMTEVPEDRVVRGGAIVFRELLPGVGIGVQGVDDPLILHANALHQAAERLDLPRAYADDLMAQGVWGQGLLASNRWRCARSTWAPAWTTQSSTRSAPTTSTPAPWPRPFVTRCGAS